MKFVSFLVFFLLISCNTNHENSSTIVGSIKYSNTIVNRDTLNSWSTQKMFFLNNTFQLINWENTKSLITKNSEISGKQYHSGWLTLYVKHKKYLCLQPNIDAYKMFTENEGIKRDITTE